MIIKFTRIEELLNVLEFRYTNGKIYACSPLSAKTNYEMLQNMMAARFSCKKINTICVNKKYNIRAWCPHAYLPEFVDDTVPAEREIALEFGKKMLSLSKAVIVFGKHLSNGMKSEIMYAKEHNIPIFVQANLYKRVDDFLTVGDAA